MQWPVGGVTEISAVVRSYVQLVYTVEIQIFTSLNFLILVVQLILV